MTRSESIDGVLVKGWDTDITGVTKDVGIRISGDEWILRTRDLGKGNRLARNLAAFYTSLSCTRKVWLGIGGMALTLFLMAPTLSLVTPLSGDNAADAYAK